MHQLSPLDMPPCSQKPDSDTRHLQTQHNRLVFYTYFSCVYIYLYADTLFQPQYSKVSTANLWKYLNYFVFFPETAHFNIGKKKSGNFKNS